LLLIEKRIKQSMSIVEIRMLRWRIGVMREERIRNDYVRGSIGVVSIVDKMSENSLIWFGHVMRQKKTKAIRMVMK